MELTLQDLLPKVWGVDQPSRLIDLLNADYNTLDNTSKSMRALLVECLHGFERTPVLTAQICKDMLERHHLPKVPNRWCIISLSKNKEKVYDHTKGGGLRLSSLVREKIPTVESCSRLSIEEGGSLLLVYSGSVSILNDDEAFERYSTLSKTIKVSDVVIWDDSVNSVHFWSVSAGAGSFGNTEIQFPENIKHERWVNSI